MQSPTYLLTADVGHPILRLVLRVITDNEVSCICDLGGGANPVLPLSEIERMGLRYVVADVSEDELAKTPPGYDKRKLDAAAPLAGLRGERFDLVISKFVAEHVADPAAFHSAVRSALRPAGVAAHFFPTMPSPPFVINRLLNGRQSQRLLERLQPARRDAGGREAKFPAYYRWCEGPTERQHRRFASVGFEVEDYVVLVGHRYYERFPALQRAADSVSRRLVRLQRPALSTYAFVVLRRTG